VEGSLQIGLDLSNDTGDRILVNTNGTWAQNTDVHGSLMMRPRFGSGDIFTAIPEETASQLLAYPNPNGGDFYIPGDVETLEILSMAGQPVQHKKEMVHEGCKIIINNPVAGLYILKIKRRNTAVTTQKIIIK
jgi:hypothetical protein